MADYYDSEAGPNPQATPDKAKPDEGGKTALIPSDLCPGMKAGEEVVLHIDRVLEGQYQVSYAPEKGEEEGESGEGESEGQGGDDRPPMMASASAAGGGMYD